MKKIKFLIWPFFIVAVFVVLGGVVLSFLEKKTAEDFFKEIIFTSNICISTIDTEVIKDLSLMTPTDIGNNENYLKLKKQVLAMGNNFKERGVDAIYILFQKEGKIYFLVESTPENDPLYIPVGELYQQPPAEVLASFKNSLFYFSDHYTDEYGTYLSSFKPIFDSSGQQVGVLGVDVDYKLYETVVQKLRLSFFSIWTSIVLFIISLFFYFRKSKAIIGYF